MSGVCRVGVQECNHASISWRNIIFVCHSYFTIHLNSFISVLSLPLCVWWLAWYGYEAPKVTTSPKDLVPSSFPSWPRVILDLWCHLASSLGCKTWSCLGSHMGVDQRQTVALGRYLPSSSRESHTLHHLSLQCVVLIPCLTSRNATVKWKSGNPKDLVWPFHALFLPEIGVYLPRKSAGRNRCHRSVHTPGLLTLQHANLTAKVQPGGGEATNVKSSRCHAHFFFFSVNDGNTDFSPR